MIQKDKLLHFLAGAVITAAAMPISLWLALAAVILAAALKELFDWMHPSNHTADILDFFATLLGAAFIWGMYGLLH